MNDRTQDKTTHLIANITHQAINPLSGVIGTLDNIIDGTIDESRRDQRLRSARAQLEYTVSLIRNLAYFAQYGGDEITEKGGSIKTTVIPQNLIEAAMFFQEQGSVREIKIELVDRRTQNAVKGDPDLLRQVFMNIFDNYIKYAKNGATVRVNQWIQKKTGDLIITIEAESTPFDNNETIFELGVRGRNAENITSSGSGLGLYICRLIVERLFRGTITASFNFAKSTAGFTIRLPNGFEKERA